MECLEAKYGRWNTANILKIQRDGQDFVILNIFFHDVFTPWFYTQGPIKNDEEWIRSDFRTMCQAIQGEPRLNSFTLVAKFLTGKLTVRVCSCFKRNQPASSGNGDCVQGTEKDSTQLNPTKECENLPLTTFQERSCAKGAHKWVPWTKATYTPPVTNVDDASISRPQKRCSTRTKNNRKSEKYDSQAPINVLIFEDLIECNGLEKGVQTRQKHVRTKRDKLFIPEG
ncbi:unnamed protein product [Echinostoma caproni]|uniref:Retrotransposon protein n=1 Tax=Echinostoma caproni TaxID=27848 RepID=A0A183A5R2_9TREM|nr:unnamed protein product [Echinostoma caproni]